MQLSSNLEFPFMEQQPIVFNYEELNPGSRKIDENAQKHAKKYLMAEAELLAAIVEVDKDRTYEKFGFAHLTPYCIKRLGLTEDVAGYFVRVARKSLQIPELKQAIMAGEISVTKAKTITSVITPENTMEWLEKAKTLTKDKLERQVADALPAGKKPERAKPSGADTTRVEMDLSNRLMQLFRRAQDIVSQCQGSSVNLVETQEQLLKFFLDHKDPVRKAERGLLRKQTSIKGDQSRGGSMRVTTQKRSTIPKATEHAVNVRDQGKCQARLPDGSICRATRWVQLHHIIRQADGGPGVAENLVTLCSSHHRLWHAREDSQ